MLWGAAATTSSPASSSTVSARQPFNYGVAADMSMVGLRDVLFVAPAGGGGGDQPIIPLLSTSPYHVEDHSRNAAAAAAIHLWQQQQQPSSFNLNPNPNLRKPMAMPLATMLDSAGGLGANISLPTSSTSTATCQDCGNQAKKDCTHRRCRTCCKGRGFDCSTHVKSTWVPAARRRETQLTTGAAVGSSGSTSASKKPRLTAATSNTSNSNTPPRSFDTSSSHQEESLPGHVRAPAVFKCVKVTPVDDGDGEYAYQAMVRIGGHVFKGFLYDQGLKERHHNGDEGNKNSNNAIPNLSELHLGGGGGGGGGNGVGGASDVYAGGTTGTLMGGGTAYGNYMN